MCACVYKRVSECVCAREHKYVCVCACLAQPSPSLSPPSGQMAAPRDEEGGEVEQVREHAVALCCGVQVLVAAGAASADLDAEHAARGVRRVGSKIGGVEATSEEAAVTLLCVAVHLPVHHERVPHAPLREQFVHVQEQRQQAVRQMQNRQVLGERGGWLSARARVSAVCVCGVVCVAHLVQVDEQGRLRCLRRLLGAVRRLRKKG